VEVNVLEKFDIEKLKDYQVVVATDVPLDMQMKINDFTHKNGVKFIGADIRGLFGSVFTDFGKDFVVTDQSGEEPLTGIISNITVEAEASVACLDETRHGLEDGDYVSFVEVKGMTEVNEVPAGFKVTVTGPYTFKIAVDTTKFGNYVSGGVFTQVKQPKVFQFVIRVFFLHLETAARSTIGTRTCY
jgi:ubiquitin-activating enzyme E1